MLAIGKPNMILKSLALPQIGDGEVILRKEARSKNWFESGSANFDLDMVSLRHWTVVHPYREM